MDYCWFFGQIGFVLFGLAIAAVLAVLIYMYLTTVSRPDLHRYDEEKFYLDPSTKKRIPFCSVFDSPSLDLSIVVPAYNESERLPAMLDEALEYLEMKYGADNSYEVIIVDDGSRDSTSETALRYAMKYGCKKVKVLTLIKNRGKGGAIRRGVLSSSGRSILFADGDGATTFEDYNKLDSVMNTCLTEGDKEVVVCGSRAHLEQEAIAERSMFRTFLMKGFHLCVWLLCVKGVKDTQCGFKLLSRPAAQRLFTSLHVERWAFDVELLYIAQSLGMRIEEVAVRWQEIEGSKLVPFWSWLQMGRDLLFIRLRYTLGLWKLSKSKGD
ncbi:dolichyl-phosphate beta-glucosyltransferase-like [Watersipora subatra]|uniref:dolichyl-phosphate beta-glucosyltransferase-like n=1 Tax=Watersipora subatra TaxID=2589382 RepID=UPI00355C2832